VLATPAPKRPSADAIFAARAAQAASTSAAARPLKLPSPEAIEAARSQQEELARVREENIAAMLSDTLVACRTSVMPKLLQVSRHGAEGSERRGWRMWWAGKELAGVC